MSYNKTRPRHDPLTKPFWDRARQKTLAFRPARTAVANICRHRRCVRNACLPSRNGSPHLVAACWRRMHDFTAPIGLVSPKNFHIPQRSCALRKGR